MATVARSSVVDHLGKASQANRLGDLLKLLSRIQQEHHYYLSGTWKAILDMNKEWHYYMEREREIFCVRAKS